MKNQSFLFFYAEMPPNLSNVSPNWGQNKMKNQSFLFFVPKCSLTYLSLAHIESRLVAKNCYFVFYALEFVDKNSLYV